MMKMQPKDSHPNVTGVTRMPCMAKQPFHTILCEALGDVPKVGLAQTGFVGFGSVMKPPQKWAHARLVDPVLVTEMRLSGKGSELYFITLGLVLSPRTCVATQI